MNVQQKVDGKRHTYTRLLTLPPCNYIVPTFVDPVRHSVRHDVAAHGARVADGEDAPPAAAATAAGDEAGRVRREVDGVVLDEDDTGGGAP